MKKVLVRRMLVERGGVTVPGGPLLNPKTWEFIDPDVPYFRARPPPPRAREQDRGHWAELAPAAIEPATEPGMPEGMTWVSWGDSEERGWLSDHRVSKDEWNALSTVQRLLVKKAVRTLTQTPSSVVRYIAGCAKLKRGGTVDSALHSKIERVVEYLADVLERDSRDKAGLGPTTRRRWQQPIALDLLPSLEVEVAKVLAEGEREDRARQKADHSVWDDPRWAGEALQRIRMFMRMHAVDWWRATTCADCIRAKVNELSIGDARETAKEIILQAFPAVSRETLERGVRARTKKNGAKKKPARRVTRR